LSQLDENRRYHSLDQLRAIMMILGLVLHSAVSFTIIPLGRAWPYQDASRHVLFDVIETFIHEFRMPLFFLMAGFFTAFLYYRRGPWGLVRNRFLRVGVPFVLFLAVLLPLTQSGFTYTMSGGARGGSDAALAYLGNPSGWYERLRTIHLWFLYYLILFYAVIALAMPVLRRLTRAWSGSVVPRLGRLIHHPVGPFVGAATTFLTLLPMRGAGLDTETEFLVQPKILAAYGVFMVFGWVLYLNRREVDGFARRAWPFMFAGAAFSAAHIGYSLFVAPQYVLAGKALAALAMWTLIYGFMGLFVRYYDRPKPLGRYLSDASYWLYLVHLPLTIWLPGLMSGWDVSAFVKSAVTLAVTAFACLFTYHYLVRSTAIGALLNGKRYPRALPRLDEKGRHLPAAATAA